MSTFFTLLILGRNLHKGLGLKRWYLEEKTERLEEISLNPQVEEFFSGGSNELGIEGRSVFTGFY